MIKAENIKTGDLLLVGGGKSFLSKAIRWFTESKVNHSGMFWWNYGVLMIIEEDKYNRGVGLITTPYDDYLKSGRLLIIRRPKFDVDGSEYGKFMLPFLGKVKYSFFDLIIAHPFYIISKKCGKAIWIGGTTMKDLRTVCSGWVTFVYNKFTGLFPDWYKKSPGNLLTDENFVTLSE
jgi:hypothetical protein